MVKNSSSILIGLSLFLTVSFTLNKLKLTAKQTIEVPEPSSICYDATKDQYFVVSDKGILFKLNNKFEIISKARQEGKDFEAACLANNLVYVSDEESKKIFVYKKKDLSLVKTIALNYTGQKNKGVEGITYIPSKRQFVLVTEKNPITISVYSSQFIKINEKVFDEASDISDITYFEDYFYFLSDEDQKIIKTTDSFKKIAEWEIPVVNPEGITFNQKELIIVSDNLQKLFFFNAF